ncbi:MAG: Gfo/Idh/MocA family oxidoreductase [Betaproteobacteria bacterium]
MTRQIKKIRVGISGLGSFSFVVANTVKRSQKVELVTCFDPVEQKRDISSARYGIEQEKSFLEMVKRPDLEGILIVSPNKYHREQTELAAQYGKHVYVEKPIANTMDDGRKMMAACDRAKVTLMIGHVHRRHSVNRKIKTLIDSGVIGQALMVEANLSSQQGWELQPGEFRYTADDEGCPGGSLMTIGVHQADTLNHIFGPVKSVFSIFRHVAIPAPVDDVTATIFTFESGLVGYIGSNFASPRTNWMRVYGTQANLIRNIQRLDRQFDQERTQNPDVSSRLEILHKGKSEPEPVALTIGDPMLEQIDEFADCVINGKKPETDALSSLKALSLIRAAIESAKTGQVVTVEKP